MNDDPSIQSVRDARARISKMFDHDPRKLMQHLRQLQERHRERLLSQRKERREIEAESPPDVVSCHDQ